MGFPTIRLLIFSFSIATLLMSCEQTPQKGSSPVDMLFREYEMQKTNDRAEIFLDTLDSFIRANISDRSMIKPYLLKGKEASMAQGMLSRTPGYIVPLLRLYPDLQNRTKQLLDLGDVMYSLRKPHAASVIYKELAKQYPNNTEVQSKVGLVDSVAIVSPDYLTHLFDQILINPDKYGVNRKASLKYVDAVEAFALVAPAEAGVPTHIYRAAEVARSMRTLPKAMGLYDWLIDDYPQFEKSPQALFIKGFILEQDYKRIDEAKAIYTQFVSQYPNHDMAESANFLLDNLGKSDNQILQEIEKRRAENK